MPRDPETIRRLAKAFEQVQRFRPDTSSIDVAGKIGGASDRIWNAALQWLDSGEMPEEPTIHGYSPSSLEKEKGLVPSAVLTALMALEKDPSSALISLEYMRRREPPAKDSTGGG